MNGSDAVLVRKNGTDGVAKEFFSNITPVLNRKLAVGPESESVTTFDKKESRAESPDARTQDGMTPDTEMGTSDIHVPAQI